jgi:hypothetical protein
LKKVNYTTCEREDDCIIVETLQFTHNNLPGSVEHICETGDSFGGICVGTGFLRITYNGQTKIIERHTWSDREEGPFQLDSVFFTEGTFTHSTTSNKEVARLVLLKDMLACQNQIYICFNQFKPSHEITLPDLEIRKLDTFVGADPRHLAWNDAGNKAVRLVECPTGCGPLMYQGINLDAGTSTSLLWRRDDSQTLDIVESPIEEDAFYGKDSVEWLNNSTVKIGDYEFSI